MQIDLSELEKLADYSFKNKDLLVNAMSHSSYINEIRIETREDNQRLEFLGDAVLELVVTDHIYQNHPDYDEGKMTKLRASMVCENALFNCANRFRLGDFILLGKGEKNTGGNKRPSVVSDAFESLIAAIYLDSGFTAAKDFIYKHLIDNFSDYDDMGEYKTDLQEYIQSIHAGNLSYRLVDESGPDHERVFVYDVMLGNEVLATGTGRNKKKAQQQAAKKALEKLKQ